MSVVRTTRGEDEAGSTRPIATRLVILSLLLLGLAGLLEYWRSTRRTGPDIVLIVVDTLRADRLPFYGSEANTAPFLNELAAQSVVFERAHSVSSWTAPATASLFTSQYPNQHGVWTGLVARKMFKIPRTNRIPDAVPTIPLVLKSLGYETFGVADNVNVSEELGFTRGFDHFEMHEYEGAERVNETVLQWRSKLRRTDKYFLYLHYMDPHHPYFRRAPWVREDAADGHLRALERWGSTYEPEQVAGALPAYDSEIGYLDSRIRELFERLRWDRKTLVIVTADHGEQFYDHGDWAHKGLYLYRELLQVPLLIYHPSRFEPGRIDDDASILDILPTLRAFAGGEPDASDMGVSLLPALGGQAMERRTLFAMRTREGWTDPPPTVKAVISGRWKYILNREYAWKHPRDREELYDTSLDPAEQNDLSARRPTLLKSMRRQLEHFEETAAVFPRSFGEGPVGKEEHLRALGYVE